MLAGRALDKKASLCLGVQQLANRRRAMTRRFGHHGLRPSARDATPARRHQYRLLTLSDALAAHGRPDEALEAADEAVDLCEALVERFGASYRSTAGWAAYTLGSRLSELGRGADAVVLHAEAVETFRNVHRHDPYRRGKHLGVALSGYAAPLLALGRYAEAVTAAEEALALYRAASV